MTHKIPDLYYYTTIETMRFILENGNIYATNLKYMNDSEEYSNGLIELKKILNDKYRESKNTINQDKLNEYLNKHAESYSISFSTQRDLLSQWSMYAGESGVSLKMNFRNPQEYCFYADKHDKRKGRTYSKKGIYPKRVYYITESSMNSKDYKKVREKIEEDIEERLLAQGSVKKGDMEGENAVDIWLDMTPYLKRYEFYQEGEYRLAYSIYVADSPLQIDYRTSKHVLIPYLDVECKNGWPIEEIIVGPGDNQQVVFTSLTHYMDNADLKVPFVEGPSYRNRCKEYFCKDKELPDAVQKIFKLYEKKLCNQNIDLRYGQLLELRESVLKSQEVDIEYKNYMMNRWLTKTGILLTKSEIPYKY